MRPQAILREAKHIKEKEQEATEENFTGERKALLEV